MGKIIITGTPGSGKSTVLSRIKAKVRIINMGGEMMKILAEKGITERDKVRYVPYSETVKVRAEVVKRVNRITEDSIIDTHASVKSNIRYIPGFSTSDLGELKGIMGVIYIDAHANEIMVRRLTDTTRARENDLEDEINQQRRINTAIASYFATYLDVPLYVVMNRQNQIEKAVADVERAVNDALGRDKQWAK